MSVQERQELEALTVWLETFPQIAQANKEHQTNQQEHNHARSNRKSTTTTASGSGSFDMLEDPDVCSAILEVASEICQSSDGNNGGIDYECTSTMGHSGDVWDTILALTQRSGSSTHGGNGSSSHSRHPPSRSLDPPVQDTPHVWKDFGKHSILGTLLDGAVTHPDLQWRKQYIERIMGLSAETQRSLMSLIERRKKKKVVTNSHSGHHPRTTPRKTPGNMTSRDNQNSSTHNHRSENRHHQPAAVATRTTPSAIRKNPPAPTPLSSTNNGGGREMMKRNISNASPRHSTRPTPESPRVMPKSSPRMGRSSPGDEMMMMAASPLLGISSRMANKCHTPNSAGGPETPASTSSSIHNRKPRNLFVSPTTAQHNNKNRTKSVHYNDDDDDDDQGGHEDRSPRRSFEQAFGSDDTTPLRPTPKRIPVGGNGAADQSFFSPGVGDTMEIEKQFQALKEQNEALAQQLAKKEAREEELVQTMEHTEASFLNEMMKVESEARRREEDARSEYQEEMQELRDALSKVQQQYREAERAQTELAGVKDEMELLAHTKNQLAETQERLQTYREKVQQLTDVREALKREEEAHSKSVEECLRLENELKHLHPLKRQLEDYKTRAVEAEVRLVEVQDEMKKVKEHRLVSMDATNDIERTLQSQQEEIFELRMRLQQETSKGKAGESSSSVGDGLSELNPELKEEVFRLRNENQRLQVFAAKREDDAVDKLERDLEDATRLGDRYKTQYLSTKDQLDHTQRNLQASRDRESKLRADVAEAMDKIKSTQAVVEDVSQQLYQCNENLTESRNRESELEGELATWVEQAKELQEQSNTLTADLRTRTNELDASQNRESKLQQELATWKEEHASIQASLRETTEQLQKTIASLEASEDREADLRDQVDQWISNANSLEDRVKLLNGKLDKVNMQLQESRNNEERLIEQVEEATQFLTESNNKCEELVGELGTARDELASTQQALQESQNREKRLQEELSDMTIRAEDAETMSKQRMELVQATREKLAAAQTETERLQQVEINLSEQVTSWTQQAEVARANSAELEREVEETVQRLKDAQQTNADNEQELVDLRDQIDQLNEEIESWRGKAKAEAALIAQLEGELAEIRQELNDTQMNLQSSKSNETNMEENITHAEHMIFSLEETIDVEMNSRQEVEKQLAEAVAELNKLKEEFEATKGRLDAQVEEQRGRSTKFQQDLFHSQETLNSMQSSLEASQHREQMLKTEVAKLQEQTSELERELDLTKLDMEKTVIKSAQSFEATCEVISTKAQKEIDEIQSNMNRLLEDERRAKRQSDEAYQLQIKQLRERMEAQIAKHQTVAKENLEKVTRGNEDKIKRLRQDYESQMEIIKKSSEEQTAQLMVKGKGMIKDVKSKAKQEQDTLREELQEMKQRFLKEQEDKETIIVQAKTKVAGYKKKLEFATSRVNTLANDTDELETKIRGLEREKFKLAEENDRYRRQLGGRGGPDSKLQGQFDLLQKEFKSAMEEARELRRKLKEREEHEQSIGALGSLDTIDENYDPTYSRDAVNQSTLVQLRTEYEETIEALNDEKRELVMKNSAAATDVQKAEKRAWEQEQENSALKQQITSLQLRIERIEQVHHSVSGDEPPPPPPPGIPSSKSSVSKSSRRPKRLDEEETADLTHGLTDLSSLTGTQSMELSRIDSPPSNTNALCQAVYDAAEETAVLAVKQGFTNGARAIGPTEGTDNMISKAHKELPSFVELHGSGAIDRQEAPPECKQC